MNRIWLIGLILSCLSVNPLSGQNVRIFTNSNDITTDDQLNLTVEVSNARGNIAMPSFPEVKGFQRTGTSTQQSITPQGMSISFSQSYYPRATGSFTIPKFSYRIGSVSKSFGPVKVNVKKGTGKKRRQNSNQADPWGNFFKDPFDDFFRDPFGGGRQQEDLNYKETNADYFMSFNLNTDTCYLGQQIIGEVVLYINRRDAGKVSVDGMAILDMQQRIKNSGFWQENYEFKQVPQKAVELNGKQYLAYTLYRTYLFPLKTGEIVFDNLFLDAKKLFVATNASIRQQIMRQDQKFEPIKIRAPKRTLTVKPLPPTDLPNASMVGNFQMNGGMNVKQINTGEVLQLELNLNGSGNMAMLPDPSVDFPEEFEVDEPSSNLKTTTSERSYYGEKSFTYYLVPTRHGDYNLGPIKFYYFDPRKKAYDSLSIPDVPVKVTGEDLENLKLKQSGEDAFYSNAVLSASNGLDRDAPNTLLLFLAPILLVLGGVAYHIFKRRQPEKAAPETKKDLLD